MNNSSLTVPFFLTIQIQGDDGPQSYTRQFNYYGLLSNAELSFSDLSDEFKHQILKTQTSSKLNVRVASRIAITDDLRKWETFKAVYLSFH